jgi:hypothetical protein
MSQRRVITLEEANALLPRVRQVVAEQRERRLNIERILRDLTTLLGAAPDSFIDREGDADDVRALKREGADRVRELQAAWSEIESIGGVIKDPREGLIDFFGRIDGKMVFLCWRYDEPEISHYHGLEEGFAGRRPIEGAVRARLYN